MVNKTFFLDKYNSEIYFVRTNLTLTYPENLGNLTLFFVFIYYSCFILFANNIKLRTDGLGAITRRVHFFP